MSVTRIFNLDHIEHAREFLDNLYLDGKKVEFAEVESGERVYFKDCTDSQAVAFARQLYEMQTKTKWRRPTNCKIKTEFIK